MKSRALNIIFCFLLLTFGHAQQAEPQKVGLVLSGGGAKGFAHIGALKVIDSLGLKPEVIISSSLKIKEASIFLSKLSRLERRPMLT